MSSTIVEYWEISDPKNPKQINPVEITAELERRIRNFEVTNNVKLFQVNFIGEGFLPIKGQHGDVKFSIPYDKVWKFMLFFR